MEGNAGRVIAEAYAVRAKCYIFANFNRPERRRQRCVIIVVCHVEIPFFPP